MTSFLLANACTGAFKMRSMKEKGGVCMRRLGIDVSEHNGILDWDAIKKGGIEFASFEGMYGNVSVSKCPMDSIIIPMLPMMHR